MLDGFLSRKLKVFVIVIIEFKYDVLAHEGGQLFMFLDLVNLIDLTIVRPPQNVSLALVCYYTEDLYL